MFVFSTHAIGKLNKMMTNIFFLHINHFFNFLLLREFELIWPIKE